MTRAELHVDRGLLISRLPDWSGPLLDMDHCRLRGPHNAKISWRLWRWVTCCGFPGRDGGSVKTFSAGPHRFEIVAEIGGVQFINDSKATNLDALTKALQRSGPVQGVFPTFG